MSDTGDKAVEGPVSRDAAVCSDPPPRLCPEEFEKRRWCGPVCWPLTALIYGNEGGRYFVMVASVFVCKATIGLRASTIADRI